MDAPTRLDALRKAPGFTGRPSSDYDLNHGVKLPEGRVLRDAAVLIAVQDDQLVLTKRASHLKHHPGQIAFPGGKVDESDNSPTAAALREAREEIGMPEDTFDVFGTLPAHETVTGFRVTPVLGQITQPFTERPEIGEVAEVFRVPLSHVLNPDNYAIEGRRWRGTERFYYTVPFGPYYIWGATARMLRALSDAVAS